MKNNPDLRFHARWIATIADAERDSRSIVYFMLARNEGVIKVGLTGSPSVRLQEVRSAFGRDADYLAAVRGSRGLEKAIHSIFGALSIGNEWFRDSRQIRLIARWLCMRFGGAYGGRQVSALLRHMTLQDIARQSRPERPQ